MYRVLLLPLLLAGCSLRPATGNHSEVPESTLSLVAEGSARACSAVEVQDLLGRQVAPDPARLSPRPADPVARAALAAIRYAVTDTALAVAERGTASVTCDAQLTVTAPDYGLTATQPVAVRYRVRPASAANDTIDVAVDGTAGQAAAQALYAQIVQQIAERQGTRPPVDPGFNGPTAPGTTVPGLGPDITADNGATTSLPNPEPMPPPAIPPAGPGFAPSFDCARVTSQTLQAICADRHLSRLDRRLSDLYRRRVSEADPADRGELIADERAWIAERQQCDGDNGCIEGAYRDRIGALGYVEE